MTAQPYTQDKTIVQIGLPVSPSEMISIDSFPATKIKISYGGGMGGSSRDIYAQKVEEVEKFGKTFVRITPFFGSIEEVNPNFIVFMETGKVVIQVVDTTQHSNHHKYTCEYSELTRFFYVKENEEYEEVVRTNVQKEAKPIHKILKTH